MANTLEELPIYEDVQKFWRAVSEVLKTPALRKDHDLYEQIADANDSIDANMKEGFEQPTDVAFANFVFTAKGSTAEVITRVKQARRKELISAAQLEEVEQLGFPLGRDGGLHQVPEQKRLHRPRPPRRRPDSTPPPQLP